MRCVFDNTGTLNLGNASGDTFTFNGGLTESTTGTVTLASTINSSNDTINFGAVTLGANTTIDTNATNNTGIGTLLIGAVTGGNNTLTLSTGDNFANSNMIASGNISGVTTLTLADIGGTAALAGDVDVTTLTVGNTVANVQLTGTGSSVANAVSFANDGTLILGQNGGTQTYNGGLTTTSVGSTVTLNGTIATSNDAVVLGAVTLASATTVDTNATSNAADITIAAITGGSQNLTLSTGNNIAGADITASGNISGVNTLTLADVGGTATLSADVDVTTLTVGNTVLNVAFTGNGSSVASAVSFANDGTLILGTSGGTQTYNGGLTTTSVSGTVTVNGTIATSNDTVVLGAVTLASATTVDTNATANTADITVAAITGGSNNLTLSTGNNIAGADVTASGAISGLGNLTLADVGGTATFSNNVAVAALSAANTVANITFTGSTNTFSGAASFANDGTLTFGNATGDSFTFNGGLTTSSVAGTVTLNTSISSSDDALTFGAVTLGNNNLTIDTNSTTTNRADITLGAITGGNNNLTLVTENNVTGSDVIASGNISGVPTLRLAGVGGTATLSGDVDVTTLIIDATVANVAFTGNGSSVVNSFTPSNDGTFVFGASGGTQTYNGGLNTASVDGTVTLNGTIASSDDALTFGAVTLGSATTIDTNSTTTNRADITIAAITGGSNALTLTTENNVTGSDVTASGNISGVTTLTLASVGGTATLSGDVDVTTLTVGNTVLNVTFTGNGSSMANTFTPNNDGTFIFGTSGGTQTYNGGLNTASVDGTVTLNGTIASSDDALTFGAVTLRQCDYH